MRVGTQTGDRCVNAATGCVLLWVEARQWMNMESPLPWVVRSLHEAQLLFPCSGVNHIMGSSLLFLIDFEATKRLFLTWDALDLVYKWRHSFRTLQLDIVVIALSLRYLKPRGRYCSSHGSHIWRWLALCLTQLTNGLECRSPIRVNLSPSWWWWFVGAYMCMRHNKNTGNETDDN